MQPLALADVAADEGDGQDDGEGHAEHDDAGESQALGGDDPQENALQAEHTNLVLCRQKVSQCWLARLAIDPFCGRNLMFYDD